MLDIVKGKTMQDYKDIIDQLIRIRKEKKLSRDALAERSGVVKQSIEKIEKGKRIPRIDTLIRLFNAMGCSLVIK